MGENCSSSCLTKDHATWGECQRAKGVRLAYGRSHIGQDYTRQKKWDRELDAYYTAKADGLNPAGTSMAKINEAYDGGGK